MRGRRRLVAVVGGAVALVAVAVTLVVVTGPLRGPGGSERPSIVLIMTDDQRWDTLPVMPVVQDQLVAKGVTFTNAFVDVPLCCPSRASILTGQYPQSTGVWRNRDAYGGFPAFHGDGSTIATWLHDAGYRTGLFGKYLNLYEGTYVPPGWDRWVALSGAQRFEDFYYGYDLDIDGRVVPVGTDPADYSTNLLAGEATSFIRRTEGPLFVYFAPFAPHAPSIPAPGDEAAFAALPPARPPSYDEEDRSDKPAWMRDREQWTPQRIARVDFLRQRAYASLLAVDRAVEQILAALEDTGRLHDTLIVFTSDNGFLFGEHGFEGKSVPYEESIRVPFVVRDDRVVTGSRSDPHMVMNVDLAPTFAAAAGVAAPGAEGRDLFPLLRGDATGWRTDFLVEGAFVKPVPGYCGIRTDRYLYAVYETGEEELYDLVRDPYELDNVSASPSMAGIRDGLRERLRQLCSPPPPGFASPP